MARLTAATACLLIILVGSAYGRETEDARLIAARSTVTVVSVATSTVQTPATCLLTISTGSICAGGRKRRSVLKTFSRNDKDISESLDSSLMVEDLSEADRSEEQQARLQVTIWATTTSPFTFTTLSNTAGITVSLSYQCSLPLQTFPPPCGK